jgi:hypothetical protein
MKKENSALKEACLNFFRGAGQRWALTPKSNIFMKMIKKD